MSARTAYISLLTNKRQSTIDTMTREEAIARARKWNLGSLDEEDTTALYELIPELRESKDERTRKEIIHYILYKADGVSEEQEHEWVAYLEGQKDHLRESAKIVEPEKLECKAMILTVDESYAKGYRDGKMDAQKEQKPVEWSGNFEENIRNLLHDKLTWHSEDGKMSSTVFIDDKTLKDIINGIWFYVSKEALKYPNKELNVAEWSEEDEKIRGNLMSLLATMRGDRITEETYQKYYPWLKSVRPSWKPSEEHLSALLAILNDPNNIGSQTCQLALSDLYEQLKKL